MTKYSFNEISSAASRLFNIRHGLETACKVKKALKGVNGGNEKQYTWNDINNALYLAGWSPKHLLMLMSNLKTA